MIQADIRRVHVRITRRCAIGEKIIGKEDPDTLLNKAHYGPALEKLGDRKGTENNYTEVLM